MNLERIINSTRDIVEDSQDEYSEADWREDRIKRSFLMALFDNRFNQQLRDQRLLLEEGYVVWAAIIQANQMLFEPNGDHTNLPGAIIYSEEDAFDAEPDALIEIAHGMFDLKGRKVSRQMQDFGDKLADEMVADIKLAIPRGFTDGVQCYYASILMARKHFPGGYLAHGFFPLLILPEETEAVMVLPHHYWDRSLSKAWR